MIHLEITTPERTVYEGDVDSITLPTAEGEITVMGGHIPLIAVVIPGTILLRSGSNEHIIAVSRGVAEINATSVRILADTADRAEELEESAIQKAKSAAEKLMSEKSEDEEAFADASAILSRELARLKTIRRHRSRSSSR